MVAGDCAQKVDDAPIEEAFSRNDIKALKKLLAMDNAAIRERVQKKLSEVE